MQTRTLYHRPRPWHQRIIRVPMYLVVMYTALVAVMVIMISM